MARQRERAQVDLVAAWGEGDYDHRMPGEAEVVEAAIKMYLRNARNSPLSSSNSHMRFTRAGTSRTASSR
jgi:hypothetical protein